MKRFSLLLGGIVCAILASIYIYPIFSGLILLPLDLLVSNSSPWHLAGQIHLKNAYMGDSVLQMFPWRHLTFTSLTSGILPLWNPYQFMGLPFMASMKPLVFYPANFLFIFGELRAWNMLLWLQLFLSLWFGVLLASSFSLGFFASLFVGVAFGCSSLMISVLQFGSEGHVLLWLPLMIYFVKKYLDEQKSGYIVGIAVATAVAIFAGQLQYFAYMSIVVTSFALYYGKSKGAYARRYLMPIVGVVLGGMIAGVQLIPGIDMYKNSARGIIGSYATFSGGLLQPYQLLRLLSPDWFGNPVSLDLRGGYIELSGYFGIIPLFFMLYGIVYARKNTFVRYFTWVAALSLIFSLNGIAQLLYWFKIPIITSGYGSRLFSLFLFSGAVLSGFGVQTFTVKRCILPVLGFAGAVVFFVALGLFSPRWGNEAFVTFQNIKMQLLGLSLFTILAFLYNRFATIPGTRTIFLILVLFLTFADVFRMGYRFLTFSNGKFLYPEIDVTSFIRREIKDSLGRVYGLTEPEVNTHLAIAGTDTYNPLYPLKTARLLQALEGKLGAPLMNNKYELTRNPRMKYALDFLGVTTVVVPQGVNPAIDLWNTSETEKQISRIYEGNGNDVYENTTAIPRFGLYYDVRDDIPDELALETISGGGVDFRNTVLISDAIDALTVAGSGSAKVLDTTVNAMSFDVESSAPAIFYLSDSYDPGWHVSLNGREVQLLRANYNFRGVLVPTGRSTIRFWYFPKSLVVGIVVSVAGCILTIAFFTYDKISKRNDYRDDAHRKSRKK